MILKTSLDGAARRPSPASLPPTSFSFRSCHTPVEGLTLFAHTRIHIHMYLCISVSVYAYINTHKLNTHAHPHTCIYFSFSLNRERERSIYVYVYIYIYIHRERERKSSTFIAIYLSLTILTSSLFLNNDNMNMKVQRFPAGFLSHSAAFKAAYNCSSLSDCLTSFMHGCDIKHSTYVKITVTWPPPSN